jgi:predicted MPP superfamily phosphohydrolase
MMLRFGVAVGFYALLNFLVATRLASHLVMEPHQTVLFYSGSFLFFLIQLWGPFGGHLIADFRKNHAKFLKTISVSIWVSYAAIGMFSCLMMFTFLVDVGGVIWQLLSAPDNMAAFHTNQIYIISALTALSLVGGFIQAAMGPRVIEVDIPLKNLPDSFDGLRIVQVSDLHISHTIGKSYAQDVVRVVNQLAPDVIVLTGDFIDGTVHHLRDDISPIASLSAPHGVYFITGNHEYYWGAKEWIAHFQSMGIRVLMNEHVRLSRAGDEIVLAGVTDYSTLKMKGVDATNPMKAIQNVPEDMVKILLAHQPVTYKLAYDAGYDLQLSGHTHGGQYFPFNVFIGLFQKYYKGLNLHKDMWIYVNRGTGYWGPPLRLGVPAEITLIKLRSMH